VPAAKKQQLEPEPRPKVKLELSPIDGKYEWRAVVPLFRYRFLFASGEVETVVADYDSSDLRGALLTARKAKDDRIVGVSDGEHVGWNTLQP